jgi:hypothetical protein
MFPNGWPGRGLLLLRVADGGFVIHQAIVQLSGSQHASGTLPVPAVSVAAGALLVFGIWTPIVGSLLALLETVMLVEGTDRAEVAILCAVIGLAVAMLGPGVWSVDAAVFGRQRLKFPDE